MKPNLYSKRLLQSLEDFVQRMHILDLADDPKLVSQLVIKWTKGQPLLTKSLLDLILESSSKIVRGQEAIAVEKIVRNRLIKEFKQDNLTLAIRKLLYTKDLVRLLTKTGGKITSKEQTYLKRIQHELGLSHQQSKIISEQYLQSLHKLSIRNASTSSSIQKFNPDRDHSALRDSYQELILLVENSPIYEQLADTNTLSDNSNQRTFNLFKIVKSKSWWLLLIIPLLFLIIKRFSEQPETQTVSATDVNLAETKCAELNLVQSSRMSLGDKLLTNNQKYNNLNPASKIALYQAIAAFSNCEYTLAQDKFEQALKISKNNPEARIYLNNIQAITQENLKIAVSVPLGSDPGVAWEILRGTAQAQTEINQQGGIQGKLLLVQIVNDDNDPELVPQLAQQLVFDRSILAVVGHNDSNTTLAASSVYQKQGLVMVSPTSSSTKLSDIGSYIMRTTPSVAILANTLSSYALVSSYNKIVVCADSRSSASTSFAEEFIADINQNGGEIAAVECDFANQNFNPVPVIEQAVAQKADALLLATSVNGIDQAISLAQTNQNRLPLLGSHSLYTFETIKTGQAAVGEMVLSVPWLPEANSLANFTADATDLWGGQVNWRTAMSYDATQAIIQGLKQAQSRNELQSVLTNPDFSVKGTTGIFRFQQGDRLGQVLLAYIGKSPQDSDRYQFLRLQINRNQ
ncbi:MAG: ABC transporter substrate-binding protein [Cyanobacteria bacterium P01_A01_bin.40]